MMPPPQRKSGRRRVCIGWVWCLRVVCRCTHMVDIAIMSILMSACCRPGLESTLNLSETVRPSLTTGFNTFKKLHSAVSPTTWETSVSFRSVHTCRRRALELWSSGALELRGHAYLVLSRLGARRHQKNARYTCVPHGYLQTPVHISNGI
ncbi:hypothetical protein GGS23DRAFT_52318 [Durotheca rogersii]|uniref:uncharacterized protein n=1 Tax=Durotheca rogersii TaxID=419775 RepID=UPI00221FE42F|nr:uncharacterized protein GGS23DRAFT_52318 [Durotheca rogersii]KAI5863089.1 hypothetical protein GGS23DRAFT_52318 [Durotheca rogersii]